MAISLTNADNLAIERQDCYFINDKGVKYYKDGDFAQAVEYYRLAAAMGSVQAVCNLGYCYMYARSVEKNMALAMAYFKSAGQKNNVDALYKLGSIYEKGSEGIEIDNELAVYYYTLAIRAINASGSESPENYPSLFLSVAKAHMPGGIMNSSIKYAYAFLQIARRGYELEMAEGVKYHDSQYNETLSLLEDPCFNEIKLYDDKSFDGSKYLSS